MVSPWAARREIEHLLMRHPRRALRRIVLGARALLPRERQATPRLYFGHPGGDVGGPLVKIKRLAERFPQHQYRFNLIYSVNGQFPDAETCRRAKEIGIPIVYNANGVFYRGWYGEGWEAQNERMRRIYELADHVFFQSRFSQLCATTFLGPPPGRHEVLHNAVDISHFRPAAQPRKELVLLTTGNHAMRYRLECIVRAFAMVRRDEPKARLFIAGRLPEGEGERGVAGSIRKLIADLGIDDGVEIVARYTQEEAPAIYHRASVFVHGQYNDVCPSAVIEAMACGLPVAYSASGGTPELVGTEAGIGIPAPLNWDAVEVPPAEALADAIREIARNHVEMGRAARQRAERLFDITAWLQRHAVVFAELLQRS